MTFAGKEVTLASCENEVSNKHAISRFPTISRGPNLQFTKRLC